MARIPLVDPASLTPELAAIYDSPGGRMKTFGVLAYTPCRTGFSDLAMAIFTKLEVPDFDRELLVLLVLHLQDARYGWVQHLDIAAHMSISDAQIDALRRGDLTSDLFTSAQSALLRLARESVDNVRISEATFAAAKAHYQPRQLVEAILTIGFYMMHARLTEGLELEPDEPRGAAIIDHARGR